jgi:gamma-D-glutamyl-L-lysine dipeptidyl-peptidase
MMKHAVCIVPVSPLRHEPSHKSEMVSQLLFGETCDITEQFKEWRKIHCTYDAYEGWVHYSHVMALDAKNDVNDRQILAGWVTEIRFNQYPMHVPMGSELTVFHESNGLSKRISFDGSFYSFTQPSSYEVINRAMQFINTPYLWGGRSVFGVDCSGFCQVVYKFFNIRLPRDAWQQANHGEPVGFLQEAKGGDLAFFDNEEGRIVHVGILLNDHEIVHASGKVRIDRIDHAGIINTDTGERTHRLRVMKKYF